MPEYCLAVIANRTQCLTVAKMLSQNGVYNTVISTPHGLGASCGIAIKFYLKDLQRVFFILNNQRVGSFSGFYKVIKNERSESYMKI